MCRGLTLFVRACVWFAFYIAATVQDYNYDAMHALPGYLVSCSPPPLTLHPEEKSAAEPIFSAQMLFELSF